MKITNDKEMIIFRKDFKGIPKYSTPISKKNKDNSFDNAYMQVKFRKDTTLRNKTKLMIKDAWFSFDKYEGKTYWYIFINDFTITDEGEMQETNGNEVNPYEYMKAKVKSDVGEQIQIDESDYPF